MKKSIKKLAFISILFLGLMAPFFSYATGAPSAQTLSVSANSATSVTVTGYYDANGSNVATWFIYGTSQSSLTEDSPTINRGLGANNFSDTITGLLPNTTYYFKAVASNFYGTTTAPTSVSFTTTSSSTSLTLNNLPATNVGGNSATLNAHYSATVIDPLIWFQYGTSPNSLTNLTNPQQKTITGNSASDTISGLSPNTTYYFRAYGSQNGNPSQASGTQSFTTTLSINPNPNQIKVPSVTTNSATGVNNSSVTLNGTVNPNGATTTAWFEVSGFSGQYGTQTLSGNTNQNIFYNFSGLTSNTSFSYRVCAENTFGGPICGSYVNFTTTGSNSSGNSLNATTNDPYSIDEDGATFEGEYSSSGSLGTIKTWFEYGTNKNNLSYSTSIVNKSSSYATLTKTISNLKEDTTYYVRFCASSSSTGTDCGAKIAFTTDDDNSQNSNLSVTTYNVSSVGQNYVYFNGSVTTSNQTRVWFEYGPTSSLGQTSISQYSSSGNISQYIGGLTSGTIYYVRIVADYNGNREYGNIVNFRTLSNGSNPNPNPTPNPLPNGPITFSITSSSGPTGSNINQGEVINFIVNYANNSGSNISGSTITITIPVGFNIAGIDRGAYNPNSKTLTYQTGSLPINASGSFHFSLMATNIDGGAENISARMTYTLDSGVTDNISTSYLLSINKDDENSSSSSWGAFWGNKFFPSTIWGWLLLIIVILLIVFLVKRNSSEY